jgi:hypothetical protein
VPASYRIRQQCASVHRSHLLKLRELVYQTVHELSSVMQADEFAEFRRTEVEVTVPGLGFQ